VSRVAIVTDSTADLGELAAASRITVIPLTVSFGARTYRDGVDLTHEEFYRLLSTEPAMPVTAQPSPGAFADVYRRLLADGAQAIVSLHLSAALSGTYGAALSAAREVDPERIAVLDTRSVSLGLGLLALQAARDAAAGLAADAIVERIREAARRVELYAAIPNLTFLARGGRIGRLEGLLGNVFQIVPIATLRDGMVDQYARVRTLSRALERLVEIARSRLADVTGARIAVLHSAAHDRAQELAAALRDVLRPAELVIKWVGPTVGTHAGPGAVGLVFIP
jgi:DegV family protein with EDD domain